MLETSDLEQIRLIMREELQTGIDASEKRTDRKIKHYIAELRAMDSLILDEVERIHEIMDKQVIRLEKQITAK